MLSGSFSKRKKTKSKGYKNKMKRNALIAIAISTAILLPCFAMAYYTIENCPACGSYTGVIFTTGGTGDLLNDTDFVSSASFGYNNGITDYWNIAEKYVPLKDTKVCAVRSKLQYSTDYGEQQVRLQVSRDSSYPAFSTNYNPTSNSPIVDTVTSDIDPITPPSSQVPAFVWFQFSPCWTALAQRIYWFEFSLRNTGYQQAKFVAYQTAQEVFFNHGGYGQTGENSWQDTGRDFSFELVSDYSQAQSELPPSSASYGFQNQDFGLLGNMFRDVVVWLFYPAQDALNGVSGLWEKIAHKPPIGYYTAVKDELGGVSIGSASITFDTTAAAGIITPLKTGIIVILWILFAFWIFHRLRNLDL